MQNLDNAINIIDKLKSINNHITILQIGANDGQQSDFVNKFVKENNVTLHTLEPIPHYYQELKNYYQNYNNVFTYNYAITNKTGTDYINFIPDNPSMPAWLKGCSSFFTDRNILSGFIMWDTNGLPIQKYNQEHVLSYIKQYTQKIPVNCITFNDFITKFNIPNIDVLVIDTEGYEYQILKQINLNKYPIPVIILEYIYLPQPSKNGVKSIFARNHYHISYTHNNHDIIAVKHM